MHLDWWNKKLKQTKIIMIINKSLSESTYTREDIRGCSHPTAVPGRDYFFFQNCFQVCQSFTHMHFRIWWENVTEKWTNRETWLPLNLSTNSKTGQSWLLRRPRLFAAPSLLSREDELGPRLELGFCEFPACFWFYKRYFLYLGFQTYWYPVRAGN